MVLNRSSRTSILIVPVLAIAGLLSSISTLRYWFPFTGGGQNEYLFPALQSLLLALTACAVLWKFGYIRKWTGCIGIIAVFVAAHSVEHFLDPRLPQQDLPCWDCPQTTFFIYETAIRFFIVSSIVFVVVLGLIRPRLKVRWILLNSLGSAVLGSLAIGLCTAWALWAKAVLVFNGEPLGILWQITIGTFLGVTVWANGHLIPASYPASIAQPDEPHAQSRFSPLYLLGFVILVIAIWGGNLGHRQLEAANKRATWINSQIARSIHERPPIASLPEDQPPPIERVMETTDLVDWKMYIHGAQRLSAQTDEHKPVLPAREEYFASFAKGDDRQVSVTITQFPNSEWAHFQLRNTPMQNAFFYQYDHILRITRFGNILYQDGLHAYWSSDDKLIFLAFDGTDQADINLFLEAYLRKYPSSIEHSDELEQLVAP